MEQSKTVLSQVTMEIIREYAKAKNIEMKDRESLVKVRNNKQALKQIKIANYAMKEILEELEPDFTELNQLVYATAYVVSSQTNNYKDTKHRPNKCKNPKWRERLKERLKILEEKYLSWRNYQREYLSKLEKQENLFTNTIYLLNKLKFLK